MEIGQKLKDKRTGRGLSQEELAEKIGVTRQTIANWEKGKTYPDIGSLIKLSDLYSVSLDELLKEDANMRKHVEESADLSRKYWNILFEAAILLQPFGLLVAYWGEYWLGLGFQVIGMLLLPPLWVARHRMFGMSRQDMKDSILGLGLVFGAAVFRVVGWNVSIIPNMMSIAGIVLIYAHGVYLERGTRFWLVIFLYVGIPVYVFASLFIQQFSQQGAFSKAQPFGQVYRIAAVEVGEASDPNLIISLEQWLTSAGLKLGDEQIGDFEYIEPAKYQQETIKGIWHLVPEESPNALYKLEVSAEDKTTLAYIVDDQLQWRWELKKLPKVFLTMDTSAVSVAYTMEWFHAGSFSGDLSTLNPSKIEGEATGYFQCSFEEVSELTLIEEYHHNGEIEIREYTLAKDKNDQFPLPEPVTERYPGEEQYILYRLQWDDGEYLKCIKFKSSDDE